MSTIVGWIIASICIAFFISFITASFVAAVVSLRDGQPADEPLWDVPTTA